MGTNLKVANEILRQLGGNRFITKRYNYEQNQQSNQVCK